jgi:hypothetical protein
MFADPFPFGIEPLLSAFFGRSTFPGALSDLRTLLESHPKNCCVPARVRFDSFALGLLESARNCSSVPGASIRHLFDFFGSLIAGSVSLPTIFRTVGLLAPAAHHSPLCLACAADMIDSLGRCPPAALPLGSRAHTAILQTCAHLQDGFTFGCFIDLSGDGALGDLPIADRDFGRPLRFLLCVDSPRQIGTGRAGGALARPV